MKKTVNKAVNKAEFETAHVEIEENKTEFKGRQYRIEKYEQGFIIAMDHGSGFRACGKFGLWDEPFVYRNEYIAKLALAKFESERIKKD